jgi:hypothetical protein
MFEAAKQGVRRLYDCPVQRAAIDCKSRDWFVQNFAVVCCQKLGLAIRGCRGVRILFYTNVLGGGCHACVGRGDSGGVGRFRGNQSATSTPAALAIDPSIERVLMLADLGPLVKY